MSPRESTRIPMPATPGSQPEREQRYVKVGRGWKNELRLRIQSGKTNCDFVSVPPLRMIFLKETNRPPELIAAIWKLLEEMLV